VATPLCQAGPTSAGIAGSEYTRRSPFPANDNRQVGRLRILTRPVVTAEQQSRCFGQKFSSKSAGELDDGPAVGGEGWVPCGEFFLRAWGSSVTNLGTSRRRGCF